jgi:hypothetical protein
VREHAGGWYDVLDPAADARHPAYGGASRYRGPSLTDRRLAVARRALGLLAVGLLASCARFRTEHASPPPSSRAWPPALSLAQAYAARGEFAAADSALAEFAARYPGTPEALETAYWRAVYRLDPSNRDLSVESSMALLDAYLADTRPHQHGAEARTLRRIAGELDRLNRLAGNALAQQAKDATSTPSTRVGAAEPRPEGTRTAPDTAAQDEIRRLRDELAKANAELERIRRRLAQPPGKPPA